MSYTIKATMSCEPTASYPQIVTRRVELPLIYEKIAKNQRELLKNGYAALRLSIEILTLKIFTLPSAHDTKVNEKLESLEKLLVKIANIQNLISGNTTVYDQSTNLVDFNSTVSNFAKMLDQTSRKEEIARSHSAMASSAVSVPKANTKELSYVRRVELIIKLAQRHFSVFENPLEEWCKTKPFLLSEQGIKYTFDASQFKDSDGKKFSFVRILRWSIATREYLAKRSSGAILKALRVQHFQPSNPILDIRCDFGINPFLLQTQTDSSKDSKSLKKEGNQHIFQLGSKVMTSIVDKIHTEKAADPVLLIKEIQQLAVLIVNLESFAKIYDEEEITCNELSNNIDELYVAVLQITPFWLRYPTGNTQAVYVDLYHFIKALSTFLHKCRKDFNKYISKAKDISQQHTATQVKRDKDNLQIIIALSKEHLDAFADPASHFHKMKFGLQFREIAIKVHFKPFASADLVTFTNILCKLGMQLQQKMKEGLRKELLSKFTQNIVAFGTEKMDDDIIISGEPIYGMSHHMSMIMLCIDKERKDTQK